MITGIFVVDSMVSNAEEDSSERSSEASSVSASMSSSVSQYAGTQQKTAAEINTAAKMPDMNEKK